MIKNIFNSIKTKIKDISGANIKVKDTSYSSIKKINIVEAVSLKKELSNTEIIQILNENYISGKINKECLSLDPKCNDWKLEVYVVDNLLDNTSNKLYNLSKEEFSELKFSNNLINSFDEDKISIYIELTNLGKIPILYFNIRDDFSDEGISLLKSSISLFKININNEIDSLKILKEIHLREISNLKEINKRIDSILK